MLATTLNPPPVANLQAVPLTLRFPLVPIELAQIVLDRSRTAIVRMIESGKLLYAFDLRARDASRPLVRIYYSCLLTLTQGLPAMAEDLEAVIFAILPLRGGNPKGDYLTRVFACSADHITGLADDGYLKPLDRPRRGKGGSPHYSRESAASFLRSRRMPI